MNVAYTEYMVHDDFRFCIASEFFEAQASKLQRRKDAMIAEWQAACEDVRARKESAHAARAKSESDYANARTQQEAERAEKALKEAIIHLKVSESCGNSSGAILVSFVMRNNDVLFL